MMNMNFSDDLSALSVYYAGGSQWRAIEFTDSFENAGEKVTS